MQDDLTLIVGGRKISGWTSIRVTRGIERLPSDFELEMTELYPGDASAFLIAPGDPCTVRIGGDTVVTGYVDRFSPSISSGSHAIRVSGRSKCADLVDCAAEWPGGQISGASALTVAKKLVAPYGAPSNGNPPLAFPFPSKIEVRADAFAGLPIETFNLNLGETPYEIIERVCRYSGLLVYDDENGDLVLSRAGTRQIEGGFAEGENVQGASISYAIDQMYSNYECYIQSVDALKELGDTGNLVASVEEVLVKRHRKKVLIAEAGDDSGFPVTKKRALWEARRRLGRSFQLNLTTDGWRDKAGALYTPNTLVPLRLPSLKLVDATWLISEVTYKRDGQSGTTCDLVVMPPEAFDVQPVVLYRTFHDVPVAAGK
ncbi:prophage tail gpP-like protein [Oxalobacteraceae bacterium GrIS 1.11]